MGFRFLEVLLFIVSSIGIVSFYRLGTDDGQNRLAFKTGVAEHADLSQRLCKPLGYPKFFRVSQSFFGSNFRVWFSGPVFGSDFRVKL